MQLKGDTSSVDNQLGNNALHIFGWIQQMWMSAFCDFSNMLLVTCIVHNLKLIFYLFCYWPSMWKIPFMTI